MSAYPNPPTGWVKTWLTPLWQWLVGLVAIVNGDSGTGWAGVRVLTAAALPANTYSTLTQTKTANANGALNDVGIDGVTSLLVGDRVWDKSAGTGAQQGLFQITDLGSASSPWKMKRTSDAAISADFSFNKDFEVSSGNTYANTVWAGTYSVPFTLDTDTPTVAQTSNVMLTNNVQTVSGKKTFGDAKLAQANSGGTFATLFASLATAARTWTFPDASDTAVGKATTDILTNKTIGANLPLSKEVDHNVAVDDSTTAATAGGAIAIKGGKSKTSGAGGAASLVGGASDTTGAGGATSIVGGAGGSVSGAGGAVSLVGGAGTLNANGGACTVDAGAKNGSGTDGVLSLGATNASAITLGRAGKLVTRQGTQAAGAVTDLIADPGTGQAIPVTQNGYVPFTIGSAGAETGTLAIPTFVGQVLDLNADVVGTGTRAITSAQAINQAGNTVMTFAQARDFIRLVGVHVGGALRWQVASNDGVALS